MKWWVVTPTCTYTEYIPGLGGGPSYDVADCVLVDAPTKRAAMRAGVKLMLADRRHYQYVHDQRRDGMSPYTGVYAKRARCQHGVEPEDEYDFECAKCDAIAEASA